MDQLEERYHETIEYLYKQLPMFSRVGGAAYKPGLDTSLKLDAYFNHPHTMFRSIHVAGTNGKGSTSHMIASVLQSQGYKTALYTSPHLVDFRERMKINGKMIPKEKVIEFINQFKNSGYDGKPSFFELTMMMAFDWFAKEKVDFAVIEVGMGGRLDSTNIISPVLSVITNISKDHTQFLGKTLPEIAGEKAGIIKSGIPVVIGETQQEYIINVFRTKAEIENSKIIFAEENAGKYNFLHSEINWIVEGNLVKTKIPLPGRYQQKNILTALSAIEELKNLGVEIDIKSINEGLYNVIQNTGLSGRWTLLGSEPTIIADTGHNIAGITYNVQQLRELQKLNSACRLHIVIGFVADKAIDEIIDLLPTDALYYVTNAMIPRALPVDVLKEKFDAKGFKNLAFDNVEEAFYEAKSKAKASDIIFVGGSTFIVADLFSTFK